MSPRVAVERKEFESFLAENQELMGRFQALIATVDRLEEVNRQLREEVAASNARLRDLESSVTEMRQSDEALRKARVIIARLIEEADKRISE